MNWKPTKIPKGFVLLRDTREQRPLFKGFAEVETLHNGDYSVRGYEDLLVVERKQLSDFWAYIGVERAKTRIKLERLRVMSFAGLVIESTERKLYGEQKYTKLTREHARGFITSAEVCYGIHVFISADRVKLERWILDRLVYGYRMLKEGGV